MERKDTYKNLELNKSAEFEIIDQKGKIKDAIGKLDLVKLDKLAITGVCGEEFAETSKELKEFLRVSELPTAYAYA